MIVKIGNNLSRNNQTKTENATPIKMVIILNTVCSLTSPKQIVNQWKNNTLFDKIICRDLDIKLCLR
ncbi:hypothetical protein COW98_03060 [Candidatus Roizmanbacteria bacterium CG22_combo_CG10-13_8_21_14_all_35_9]|uniref:Uncharacterized protein n=1 Tax=Candidatus Roizmanbacteria bacterium CG22_combo_CG10-13_8_21_14_all_35_9 TaxID=1974861 RepID=A0A2H0BY25_9BACT|nr:MAG: hypothetical protein COW98_03060 [Candidatus Roizmanbacteria bacterium CG22_combo_CG10-13_8_21_14_all_35_9]